MDWGSLIGGTVLGGAIGWYTAQYFYARSTTELKRGFQNQLRQLEKHDTLSHFEDLVANGTWHSERINNQTAWICDQKASFKIVEGDEFEPFTEEWTTKYPDQNTAKQMIDLRINDSTVKSLTFVNLDGGRYLVPLTKMLIGPDKKPVYFWDKDSIEFKVGRIIGTYYRFENIEEVARDLKIEIVSGRGLPQPPDSRLGRNPRL